MKLTTEELNKRLSSGNNILNNIPGRNVRDTSAILPNKRPFGGRNPGDKNIPSPLKTTLAVLSKTEPAREVASTFGVSQSSVMNFKHGRSLNKEERSNVEQTTEKIRDAALTKLMASLGIITDETLANTTAKDASGIARNLAGVVEKLTPRSEKETGNQVNFIVYAPQVKEEAKYKTIEITGVE